MTFLGVFFKDSLPKWWCCASESWNAQYFGLFCRSLLTLAKLWQHLSVWFADHQVYIMIIVVKNKDSISTLKCKFFVQLRIFTDLPRLEIFYRRWCFFFWSRWKAWVFHSITRWHMWFRKTYSANIPHKRLALHWSVQFYEACKKPNSNSILNMFQSLKSEV